MTHFNSRRQSSAIKISIALELAVYMLFYVIKLVLFILIRIFSFHLSLKDPTSVVIVNNIIVGYVFSIFTLYFVMRCAFSRNIYGYYIAAALMLHNFLLTGIIMGLLHSKLKAIYWGAGGIIAGVYLLEFAVTLSFIRMHRGESNRALFRTIGADPIINRMYSTRRKLETLSVLNVFIPIVMTERLYLPPRIATRLIDKFMVFGILLLTVGQQVFIYIRLYEEDIVQRRVAIGLTVAKLVMSVGLLVGTILGRTLGLTRPTGVRLIFYLDELLISGIFIYYLLEDTRNFGRGLKRRMEKSIKRLALDG